MLNKYKLRVLICFAFLISNVFTQSKECEVEKLNDGKIRVKYCFSNFKDKDGADHLLIQDSTTSIADIDFEKCILLMKDVSKHKLFTGDSKSYIVKAISDTEWIIYYYSDNPWPVANSDCVSRMRFVKNKEAKTAIFELVATPSEFEDKGVNRMQHFKVKYIFENLSMGKVRITIIDESSPAVYVPMWLIKSAFPSAPADAIRNLIELVKRAS